jgi:hypothetical protein
MSTNSGNLTNASGTVTTGGASNVLLVAAQRQYLFIENPTTGPGPLYVAFGAAAVPGTAYELAPGGSLTFETGLVPGQSVNVRSATSAAPVICWWA